MRFHRNWIGAHFIRQFLMKIWQRISVSCFIFHPFATPRCLSISLLPTFPFECLWIIVALYFPSRSENRIQKKQSNQNVICYIQILPICCSIARNSTSPWSIIFWDTDFDWHWIVRSHCYPRIFIYITHDWKKLTLNW